MTPSAVERKRRSEKILEGEAVPFIPHLPVVEDEETAQFRTLDEVVRRAMAFFTVAARANRFENSRVLEIVDRCRLEHAFTPKEQAFMSDDSPSDHDRVLFTWRVECCFVLLWALNYFDDIGRPDRTCDVQRVIKIFTDLSLDGFIRDAKLRPASEILDAVDLIYRYHWACRDAALNRRAMPAGLDSGVVMERHHALNWLVGYMDRQEWDDVTTDT